MPSKDDFIKRKFTKRQSPPDDHDQDRDTLKGELSPQTPKFRAADFAERHFSDPPEVLFVDKAMEDGFKERSVDEISMHTGDPPPLAME